MSTRNVDVHRKLPESSDAGRRKSFVAALFVAIVFSSSPLHAAPITIPTSLNPGDQYRLAFVTSTTRNAASSNISDYNAFVSGVASGVTELAALGTTWKAIGSTATVDARDNTGTNPNVSAGVPIFLLNDTKLVDSNADLWDGAVDIGFNFTETEQTIASQTNVWTGTLLDGTAFPNQGLGSAFVSYGAYVPGFLNLWVFQGQIQPVFGFRLYALSDILVVPEPSTLTLATACGLLGIVGHRRRKRR